MLEKRCCKAVWLQSVLGKVAALRLLYVAFYGGERGGYRD